MQSEQPGTPVATPAVKAFRIPPPPGHPAPLSTAAVRMRDGLGLPITALPGLERENAVYVREHTQTLNDLIDGRPALSGAWRVIGGALGNGSAGGDSAGGSLRRLAPPEFPALWSRGEVAEIEAGGLPGVERTWRRRAADHPFWAPAAGCIRREPEYAEVWREILGGDFDTTGRGVEYTAGMEVFQASRWFGARTLLSLLGAREGAGLFLDVLGGDGYVWRLLRAENRAAEPHLVLVDGGGWPGGGAFPAPVAAAVDAVLAAAPWVAVLVVGTPADPGAPAPAALLRVDEGETRTTRLALDAAELARLESVGGAVWHDGFHPGRPAEGARIVTNDLSPHMFTRAGAWGFPTREDATRLTRTFHPASVDGVLLAYGTHHIADLFAAAREAARVVKPGGRVVVHDFLDEGPAGQWFHHIVDKRSITGHDFPHVGPVQMAAMLLAAGLREVRLHEIQDPFLFACDDEAGRARELALGYISGMYGLAAGFPGGPGELEAAIHEYLAYPEVGEVPVFAEGFVYIPRRAAVATAVRPQAADAPYGDDDLRLVRTLATLFRRDPAELVRELALPDQVARYWFPADGRRWGLTPREREHWLAWADSVLAPA